MRSMIRWFVDNPIAANILMIALLLGGWTSTGALKKEVFPTTTVNLINVNMNYPGAAPSEVEQQIVIRIEEAIAGLPGIFQITSESREGSGRVSVEVIEGYNVGEVLSDIKARVDAINTFPPSAERPIVNQQKLRNTLGWFSISGDADLATLKDLGYRLRDEMPLLDGISEVVITGLRVDELAVEISEHNLQQYRLSFDDIARAIRGSSLNNPAGTIKSEQGDVQIQTRAQAYNGEDFANIVVRSFSDGSQLLLGDIATIKDGFAEQEHEFVINGNLGLNFEIKLSDDPDLFGGTVAAREYLQEFKKTLPEGLKLIHAYEDKSVFDERFNLLKDNVFSGLILVFIILMLFLRPLVALWVVGGIATAFLGAVWILPYFDVSLNMLSMFAFLMVLGIVVDDAIIVAESIYSRQQQGIEPRLAATAGTTQVLKPVILAVTSTIVFFLPMVDVPTEVKPYTVSIFYVVMFCLLVSLVECLLILPSHLSHMKPERESSFAPLRLLGNIRHSLSEGMMGFARNKYQPCLKKLLRRPGSTFLAFVMLFGISVSIFTAGWVKGVFFPSIPQPFATANVTFPEGSPYQYSTDLADHFSEQARALKEDSGLLEHNNGEEFLREFNTTTNGNSVSLFVGLTPAEEREVGVEEVTARLRELIGPIPEAQSYSLGFSFGGNRPDIALNLRLSSNSPLVQQEAVEEIRKVLGAYEGVVNARSDLDTGRLEVELHLKPYAQTLGISMADVASQVRQAFYGEEVQRIPRSKEDVKVMLRYSEAERRSMDTLDDMRVRTPDMDEIPLAAVANIDLVPGASTIRRTDRFRNISITADVLEGYDPNQIATEMLSTYVPEWQQKYSGFKLSTEGNLRAQARFGDNFKQNFLLALAIAFALFAIAFGSVFQPLLVLLAVPFGFMGAIVGHLVWGHELSMFSFFGFLACAGVVVNDNLVLLDRINHLRREGLSALDAVTQAGVDRFRPIVLTSLTTFVGLMPILFERSTQAQFLIPMVLSLSFGILLSSVVTLLMVPCTYFGGHNLGLRISSFGKWLTGKARQRLSRDTASDDSTTS
ncbi:MAG: efflux RND transporter permease subunit [Gammaproteobacteria bacterium]|nr:efflux RND transporter permease subunit [Gammaproteobacteria bacterium]